MVEPQSDEPKDNRQSGRRFRYTIRFLLLIMLTSGIALAWGVQRWKYCQRERDIVEELQTEGIKIQSETPSNTLLGKMFGGQLSLDSYSVELGYEDHAAVVPLSQLQTVEHMTSDLFGSDLFAYCQFENLKSLTLQDAFGLERLNGVESLRHLEVLEVVDSDNLKSLEPLMKSRSLRDLRLDFDDNSSLEDYEQVLSQLTELRSFSTDVFLPRTLKCFAEMRNLESVKLDGQGITSLAGLELPNLKTLHITYCREITDWSALSSMPAMEDLSLSGASINSVEFLRDMKHLKKLYLGLNHTKSPPNLEPFLSLIGLEELKIKNVDFKAMKSLDQFTALRKLDISGDFSSTDFSRLTILPRLENLRLSGNKEIKSLDGIDNLKTVREVTLQGCRNLTDISALSKLPGLSTLTIANCKNVPAIQLRNLKTRLPRTTIRTW